MQVFKLFFKIVNRYKFLFFLTIAISFGMSFLFASESSNQMEIVKTKITIIDEDHSDVSKDLMSYLQKVAEVKDIDSSKIEEALYYRHVEYVLYIPSGYAANVLAGKNIILEKKQVPDSMSAYVMDQHVASYTNTAHNYAVYGEISDAKELIKLVNSDLDIHINSTQLISEPTADIQFLFNFMAYGFMVTIISIVGYIMITLNKTDIKRRNTVAPISTLSMNIQLLLGILLIGIGLISVVTLFGYIIFGSGMTTPGAYLYIVNMLIYLVPTIGIAYLLGAAIKSIEALNGVSNILCLAFAFLGGAFVPLEFLSSTVQMIGKITPSYWFVSTNEQIRELTSTSVDALSPILQNMGVQILYGIIVITCAILISKRMKRNII